MIPVTAVAATEATYPVTVAASHLTEKWEDLWSPTWSALCHRLTDHRVGAKAGPCFTPATFRGTRRLKSEADEIAVAVLDLDDGARSLPEIRSALETKGWAGIVYSTHSHAPDHPKFRLVIPLARPWRAADYPTQDAANAAWRDRVEALAAALGLAYDRACTDTSRLYYLPRHPEGAEFETSVIDGTPCDVWSLPSVAPPPKPANANPPQAPAPRADTEGNRYANAAFNGEITKVRAAGPGTRNNTLNTAALKLGGLVGAGALSEGNVRSALTSVALASGLGVAETEATLNSGLTAGIAKPRQIPEPRTSRPEPWENPPRPEYDPATGEVYDRDIINTAIPATEGKNEAAAAIDELNRKYMVVNESGKAIIYAPGYDPVLKRERIDRVTFEDLSKFYMNQLVRPGGSNNGTPILKSKAYVWLNSARRRQYLGGVVFDPSGKTLPDDVLNLWKGFPIRPRPGDWSLLRDHMCAIICCSDPVRFAYLLGWLARLVQHPAEQGEVAVVVVGDEGTGKGTLAKVILKIVGQHGIAINNAKHLVGNFNEHLRDAIFLFADEAFFAGDKAHVGTLKSLITEPYQTIEAKYQNAVQTPNYLHVMMASNEDWVVPASLDSRRFFVLNVDDTVKGNHDYFGKIWEQMDSGGYEGLLHDLLNYDLTSFNVRAVPVTAGLQEQRKLSLGTTESWWLECLERGYVFKSSLGLDEFFSVWNSEISTELLHASYSAFAKSRNERHPLGREGLGKFLHAVGCQQKRLCNAPVAEHMADDGCRRVARPFVQPRAPGYRVGNLADARVGFVTQTGLSITWADEEP